MLVVLVMIFERVRSVALGANVRPFHAFGPIGRMGAGRQAVVVADAKACRRMGGAPPARMVAGILESLLFLPFPLLFAPFHANQTCLALCLWPFHMALPAHDCSMASKTWDQAWF